MRSFFTIMLSAFLFHASAQNTYNNKIGEVKELKIYGSDAKIVIGKIIVNETLETKLYLINSTQLKDDSNYYVTKFNFGNNQSVALFGAKITMKFNKPVLFVNFGGFSTATAMGFGISADKTSYVFKAQQINRDPDNHVIITFIIKSKERITTEVSGVDGILSIAQ
ncbi:hypothetical protein SAMN05216490_4310 [Mucilaginibacter mallensis]|uniref:Uncharacterized protein n=1 Tax=Mucilaginibacter mallensis TaxID=652787 RepID=A0A1H2BS01_MUCMA|nr:hypothetical protein [Mucilaginibacter mallensis]SDT60988.1 hypothetical protein SAMN05216490_4310 [Mucilaginibacter mallensis]